MAKGLIGSLRVRLGMDSAEFERGVSRANKGLAGFARRAKQFTAAAAAAAAASGVAMVRSSLRTVDAQAKLAQSLGTTVASIQTLSRAGDLAGVSMSGIEQATKDLTRRLSQAAAGGGPAAKALDRLGLSASELLSMPLDERVGAINAAIENFVPAAERAAVAGQLFGEEGSIAMSRIDTATLRQATEDVHAFGVVLSEQDADQFERTNDAISRLGLIFTGLGNQLTVAVAPAMEAIADAMAAAARQTGPLGRAIQVVGENLDRIGAYAATFATFMAGRWVAGLAAAALSVRGLATALVLVRGALIRTGIGALIVGAGELAYQFTKLVDGAGGVGDALGLLKDVAVEVWDRIKRGASLLGESFYGVGLDIKAAFTGAFTTVLEKFAGLTQGIADGWNSLMSSLGIESNATGIGSELAASMRARADELATMAGDFNASIAESFGGLASEPLESVEKLRATVRNAGEDGADALDKTKAAGDRVTEALGNAGDAAVKAGSSAGAAAKKANALADSMDKVGKVGQRISSGLSDAFAAVVTGAGNARDVIRGLIADLARMAAQSAFKSLGLDTLFAGIFHDGGVVGTGGSGRMVPAMAFAGAPRMHSGGFAGLRPDEVPAILQRGERVLSRREVANGAGGAVEVSISVAGDGSIVPVIERVSGNIAARAVQAGMAVQDRKFPAQVSGYTARQG